MDIVIIILQFVSLLSYLFVRQVEIINNIAEDNRIFNKGLSILFIQIYETVILKFTIIIK